MQTIFKPGLGINDENEPGTARRAAKESVYWLKLLLVNDSMLEEKRILLINEAIQIKKILSAIISKVEKT